MGASGYVGSHLVPRLIAAGHEVRASARDADVLRGRGWDAELVSADALRPETLPAARPAFDTSTAAFVLRQALEQLPEEYREPLLMQVIHGYSQKEIAAHLGISVGGAGTRLFRARQQLRQLVTGE